MTPPSNVASSDGVRLAVHDLGGSGPTLLFSHAHGLPRSVLPADRFIAGRTFHSVAFDYRGHGDTLQPDARSTGTATATMRRRWPGRSSPGGAPVVGFGHSMGGTCL